MGAGIKKGVGGKANIVALTGALGAGKTTFVQGLAKGLGIEGRIVSPTFILMRKYKVPQNKSRINNLFHVDLYRLEGDLEREVEGLGLTEIWNDPGNVVVIEWADRMEKWLPKGTRWVRFEYKSEDERRIRIDE